VGRLYFKIFLWFWLGVMVVSVTLVSVSALTHSRAEDDRRWKDMYGPRLDLWARQEIDILSESGPRELGRYLSSFEYQPGVSNYIFDSDGHEVLGRTPPPQVVQAVSAASRRDDEYVDSNQRILARTMADANGRRYTVVMDYPAPSILNRSLLEFLFASPDGSLVDNAAITRVLAVLAVGAIFCVWLAWQIVEPIDRLRFTTRAIAHERLQARVDQRVLARRDALGELGHDFDRMAERIETLVTAERRLLADVSHALRSPLARLNVALGLARKQTPPQTAEHLDRIEREAEAVNKLIGQLLTMARIDSGVDVEHQARFELGALVEEVAADADYEARTRSCTVTVSAHQPCYVRGARELLRGAIENVARNAVRHTKEGTRVEITVGSEPRDQTPLAVIAVRDHGAGVPSEEIEKLFLPFMQVGDAATRKSEGTGLGLAITKRTFELFGGSAAAANADGGGLLVTMKLPLC
jgi:two-component system sensor histidine kinase CpxA